MLGRHNFYLPLCRSTHTHTHRPCTHTLLVAQTVQQNDFFPFPSTTRLTRTHTARPHNTHTHTILSLQSSRLVTRTADSTFAKYILFLTFLRFMRKSFSTSPSLVFVSLPLQGIANFVCAIFLSFIFCANIRALCMRNGII